MYTAFLSKVPAEIQIKFPPTPTVSRASKSRILIWRDWMLSRDLNSGSETQVWASYIH